MIWSPIDVVAELHKNGLTGRKSLAVAVAICRAESGFDDQAKLDNTTLTPPGKGVDRGLFQINSHWHPEVTDAMAFDGATNIREAVRIYRANSSRWTAWSTFTNGRYKAHLEMAGVAVEAFFRGVAASAQLAAVQASLDMANADLGVLRPVKEKYDAIASIVTGTQVSGTA